jgi:hypothetical protein
MVWPYLILALVAWGLLGFGITPMPGVSRTVAAQTALCWMGRGGALVGAALLVLQEASR